MTSFNIAAPAVAAENIETLADALDDAIAAYLVSVPGADSDQIARARDAAVAEADALLGGDSAGPIQVQISGYINEGAVSLSVSAYASPVANTEEMAAGIRASAARQNPDGSPKVEGDEPDPMELSAPDDAPAPKSKRSGAKKATGKAPTTTV